MEISIGIEAIGTALWIKKERTLIINDLHIGYEEILHHKGILVPKFQLKEILRILKDIIKKTKPQRIIINGDLKHEFGKVLRQEWKEILAVIDFCLMNVKEIIIIQGNHDSVIKPIADKRGIHIFHNYLMGDLLIVHGDALVNSKANIIIIGHEHPAITIKEGSKWEKYKCFLRGNWKEKEIIVMPSFNPLLEGTDVLQERLLSPYLDNLNSFEVYVVGEKEVFAFGRIKDIQQPYK